MRVVYYRKGEDYSGDELVEVHVETPRNLTGRQEELLRELAEIEHRDVSPKRKSFFDKLKDYFTEDEVETGAKAD